MAKRTIEIKSNDKILRNLQFKPYRNATERRVSQFLPDGDEPQTIEIVTPWGGTLTCESGDYIVNELGNPENRWPVDRKIFEDTYSQTRPGYYVKSALTHLVPLVEIAGHPNRMITVHTLEGAVTVRAGDFYLARGSKGEIWPIPRKKVKRTMVPVG
ncbi:MAG: hypothetical protein ACE5GO_03740 [Anaerolineales bacterium]